MSTTPQAVNAANDSAVFIQAHPSTYFFVIEMVLGIFGVVGNGIVCLTVIRARSMHNLTNYLILNLAVADLCACICLVVFSEKLFLAFSPQGQLAGSFYCILCADKNATWFFSYAAVLSLTVVTLERYCAIVYPFQYIRYFTAGKAWCYVISGWVIAFFIEFPYLFVPRYSTDSKTCYYVKLAQGLKVVTAINTALFTFVAPLACMVFAYWRIIRSLKKRAVELMNEGTHSPAQELFNASKKVVKTLLIVTAIFIALWVPIQTCCSLLSIFPSMGSLPWFHGVYSGLRTVGYINSVLNVIVYSVKYKQFRLAVRATICPSVWNRVKPADLGNDNNSRGGPDGTKVSHVSK